MLSTNDQSTNAPTALGTDAGRDGEGSNATTLWKNNHTQFGRLLAEIYGLPLTPKQYEQLKASMDLGYEDIDELFERAMLEWERAKKGKPVRKVTPQQELEAFVDGSSL